MTSRHTTQTAPQNPPAFRLPDIPEKHPDDMTSSKQLNQSQGGMCICRVLGIGAGVSRECFGP